MEIFFSLMFTNPAMYILHVHAINKIQLESTNRTIHSINSQVKFRPKNINVY